MLFIVITIALISSAWLCYEMHRAPLIKDKEGEDINDPTTTCWYDDDDDYHPDTKI
jgi:hypothetical protein